MKSGEKLKPLEIVVPGLCGPLPDLQGLSETAVTASLARMLVRADKSRSKTRGFHSELAVLFGMDEAITMPSAALSLLGYGYPPGEGSWIHADPVHLQADMDHAILRDSQSMDIPASDADALVEEINQHFSDDNIRLVALDPDHWFLNIGERDVVTTPLHDVIGRNVNFFLPKGKDEKFIKSLMNEIQMLFHMSKVNQEREACGLLPVNSLWLWGEGKTPAVVSNNLNTVYSNHTLVKGLSELHGIQHKPVENTESLLASLNDETRKLLVFDDLFTIACYGDVCAWQQSLESFFVNWLEPVVSYAMRNKTPVQLYPCNGVRYRISPGNRYRILRRAKIKDHIAVYE